MKGRSVFILRFDMRTIAIICALFIAGIFLTFQVLTLQPEKETGTQSSMQMYEKDIEQEGRYLNERYGFSFLRPEGAAIHEHKDGPDAATIRVEDVGAGEGFQVFVIAYPGTTISNERFRMDIPSGVRQSEEVLTLDGIPATAFMSEDATLGQTREVWFLKGGYLYEITAPLSSDTWLENVLQTWKFENIERQTR